MPGVDERENGSHPLGSGPVIERGSVPHPAIVKRLLDVARAEGIACSVAALPGTTSTDADAVHVSRGGIPTAIVSLPLRSMHSSVEVRYRKRL